MNLLSITQLFTSTNKHRIRTKEYYWFVFRGAIEFRDVRNFSTVVYDHSIYASDVKMHTSSGTALWFVSHPYKKEHIELQELRCSSLPLPNTDVVIILGKCFGVRDMCYVQQQRKSFLVLACGVGGVRVYNTSSKHLEWSVNGMLHGMDKVLHVMSITADEDGHVFVLDLNNKCIHMFTVNGKYITTLLREGEQGLGQKGVVRWSEGLSALIVLHQKDAGTWVSLVKS